MTIPDKTIHSELERLARGYCKLTAVDVKDIADERANGYIKSVREEFTERWSLWKYYQKAKILIKFEEEGKKRYG